MQTIRGGYSTKDASSRLPRVLFGVSHDRVKLTGQGTEIRGEPESRFLKFSRPQWRNIYQIMNRVQYIVCTGKIWRIVISNECERS